MRKPDYYFIKNPENKQRCFEILGAFGGKGILQEEENYRFAWCDSSGIYLTKHLPEKGYGKEIPPEPTLERGQKVLHFRSGRVEYIRDFGLVKLGDKWENCVIYGIDGKIFVRELENFKEAFVNKE